MKTSHSYAKPTTPTIVKWWVTFGWVSQSLLALPSQAGALVTHSGKGVFSSLFPAHHCCKFFFYVFFLFFKFWNFCVYWSLLFAMTVLVSTLKYVCLFWLMLSWFPRTCNVHPRLRYVVKSTSVFNYFAQCMTKTQIFKSLFW